MPKEIADYLNKISARIPNIKPGRATIEYLKKIQASTRFWGIHIDELFLLPSPPLPHIFHFGLNVLNALQVVFC